MNEELDNGYMGCIEEDYEIALRDIKDLEKQLQAYKDREKKIKDYIEELHTEYNDDDSLDAYGIGDTDYENFLQILNKEER